MLWASSSSAPSAAPPGIPPASTPPSPAGQLFNLAYARHEIVSDHTDACLAWLEAGGATPVDDLLLD